MMLMFQIAGGILLALFALIVLAVMLDNAANRPSRPAKAALPAPAAQRIPRFDPAAIYRKRPWIPWAVLVSTAILIKLAS